jgi:ubiquinone/menaquinone biosynthesis C-methylase UbiE
MKETREKTAIHSQGKKVTESSVPMLGSYCDEGDVLNKNLKKKHIESAGRHLDTAGIGYLNGISGSTPESLKSMIQKLQPLADYLHDPSDIVSVGIGQGEDVHALSELFKNKGVHIHGIDISGVALAAAKERAKKHNLSAEFLPGSATELPLDTESVDGLVLSSVLHEVYSYLPYGKYEWQGAIREAARVLKINGCLLLRDPAAPETNEQIKLEFKTDEGRKFYKYFKENYRVFSAWDEAERETVLDKRTPDDDTLPELNSGSKQNMLLPFAQLANFMLHFRNYWNDLQRGQIKTQDDLNWREINESYFVPNGDKSPFLTTSEYVKQVLGIGNYELKDSGNKLICIQKQTSSRLDTDLFLSKHFHLTPLGEVSNSEEDSVRLIGQATRKMELVFKKVKQA